MPKRAPTHLELLRRKRGRRERDKTYEEKRRRDPALALAKKLRSSQRWRKLRALKLARDPLCEACLRLGVRRKTTQVHHIEPIVRRPELAFVMSNLLSLCGSCHMKIEADERRGVG